MGSFVRPKLVVSKCIEFEHCRYDGSMIPSDFVKALKLHADFIPVCAEMEIGLGVPRDPIRIVWDRGELRLVQPTTGLDVTENMRNLQLVSSSRQKTDSFSRTACFLRMKDIKIYSGSAAAAAVSKPQDFGRAVVKSSPTSPSKTRVSSGISTSVNISWPRFMLWPASERCKLGFSLRSCQFIRQISCCCHS